MRRGITVGSFLWSRLTNSFSETSESFDSFKASTSHSTQCENDLQNQKKNNSTQKLISIHNKRKIDVQTLSNDSIIFATSPSMLTSTDEPTFQDERYSFQPRASMSTKKSKSAAKMNTKSQESFLDDDNEKHDVKKQKSERHFTDKKQTKKKKRPRENQKTNKGKEKNDLKIRNKIMIATELSQTSSQVNSKTGPTNYRNESVNVVELPFSPAIVGTYTCHGLEPSESLHSVDPLSMAGSDITGSIDFGMNSKSTKQRTSTDVVNVDRITGLSFVNQKINQDRGSVVYPFGNHPDTALFAVYDGKCKEKT